ncbi:inovirus-type Gp2 protein, partial [Providencia stuartii]
MTNRALHLNQVVLSTTFEHDRLTLTRDHSLRELVSLLMGNIKHLSKRLTHKLDLYKGIPLSPNNPRLQLTSTSSKGELFLETLKFTRYIQSMKISQIQRLHPTLVLLLSLVNKYHLSEILIDKDKYWMVDIPEHVQWLNEVFREFQSTLKSPDYKKQVRAFEQGAQKNYRRAQQYIDSLYQRYSKLLVVRVDLSYKSGICHRVKAHHLRQHRQALYKAINRDRLFSCCVGYILKLEFGMEKGFHYHALFFFDGQKVRRDITLGKHIGELWQERI